MIIWFLSYRRLRRFLTCWISTRHRKNRLPDFSHYMQNVGDMVAEASIVADNSGTKKSFYSTGRLREYNHGNITWQSDLLRTFWFRGYCKFHGLFYFYIVAWWFAFYSNIFTVCPNADYILHKVLFKYLNSKHGHVHLQRSPSHFKFDATWE